MRRRARWVGAALLALLLVGLGFAIGRPAIEVQSPRPGELVGVQGLDLLARFAPDGGIEPATVRVLLNGADVTSACITGRNGVQGRLHGLLDGENRVRVEAFARGPAGLFVERADEVRVLFRPPIEFDRG